MVQVQGRVQQCCPKKCQDEGFTLGGRNVKEYLFLAREITVNCLS